MERWEAVRLSCRLSLDPRQIADEGKEVKGMHVIPRSLVGLLAMIPLALQGSLAQAFPATDSSRKSLPTSTTAVEARKPCDLDGSGRCDLGDRYLLQLVGGACEGDRTYFSAAEVDGDGCITVLDESRLFNLDFSTVDPTTQASIRETLHEVIDDHTKIPYTSSSTDTWDVLELADQDPVSSTSILDVYKNATYAKFGAGNNFYNREHTWPNSYGFPDDGASNYPYTDCHALFLSDSSDNSSRGNNPYRTCSGFCTERPTNLNHGRGGGIGVYPGNSNWRMGSGSTGTWETWIGRRGDVARALFYLDLRYEGDIHSGTGVAEPDLIITDDGSLIATSGGVNAPVAYMGMLSTLLQWHEQDPVDDLERDRNEVIASYQGNRNPFIDHPEWVRCAMVGACVLIFQDGFEGGDTHAWGTFAPTFSMSD